MTDTVKHMWDQVEKARADGTFSSDHAAVPAQDANGCVKIDDLIPLFRDAASVNMTEEAVERQARRFAEAITSLYNVRPK